MWGTNRGAMNVSEIQDNSFSLFGRSMPISCLKYLFFKEIHWQRKQLVPLGLGIVIIFSIR